MTDARDTTRVGRRHEWGRPPTGRAEALAVEEPLEIRVSGATLATTMRTPGDDRALALGFLFAEGVLADRAAVDRVFVCLEERAAGPANVVDVVLARHATIPPEALLRGRRGTLTTAACGVCGRRSIADLLAHLSPIADAARLPAAVLEEAPRHLAAHQPLFERTGAVHGAALLDGSGRVLAAAEDIGRHNAVDRAVGQRFFAGRLPDRSNAILVVSGRVSFEIVQKAAAARIPFVVAVGGPTSLAADLAEAMGVTLAAYARPGRFTVYSHPERVAATGPERVGDDGATPSEAAE